MNFRLGRRSGGSKVAFGCLALLAGLSAARALDRDLARFVNFKESQVREFASGLTNKVPPLVWSFFDAVRVDDWETATNLGARISQASGRYTNSTTEQTLSPALSTLIWPPISETIGTYEQFHEMDEKWLHGFGREIIDSIPKGSVYFGGTDPGRFVISALCESQAEGKPFFTITQNQLADGTYLEYLRRIYGRRLNIPSEADSTQAFQDYLTDAQERLKEGRLKPGEDVRMVDDRVQVRGQVAVMEINGLLVKIILRKNPEREFYLEESFALEWMYPYLVPHGLIFQLETSPLSQLKLDAMQKDQAFWKKLTSEILGDWPNEKKSSKELCDFADRIFRAKDLTGFKGDTRFVKDAESQKTFSKLRSSIGGWYVWWGDHAQDADARSQARRAAEVAFRQAYALCPFSPEAVHRYVNLLIELNRPDDAFLLAKTSMLIEPDDSDFQQLVRQLKRQGD